MDPSDGLLPKHGGYRRLRSFQVAQLVYDGAVVFCGRFVEKSSRTHDQMVQAARSGVQNIAEGGVASATSKKTELKLTNVARASLEELLLDYQNFLRQRGLRLWVSPAVFLVMNWLLQEIWAAQDRPASSPGSFSNGVTPFPARSVGLRKESISLDPYLTSGVRRRKRERGGALRCEEAYWGSHLLTALLA